MEWAREFYEGRDNYETITHRHNAGKKLTAQVKVEFVCEQAEKIAELLRSLDSYDDIFRTLVHCDSRYTRNLLRLLEQGFTPEEIRNLPKRDLKNARYVTWDAVFALRNALEPNI